MGLKIGGLSNPGMDHPGCVDTGDVYACGDDCSLGTIWTCSSWAPEEGELLIGDGNEESCGEGPANSMGVMAVMVSSGDANLSCEIGDNGEGFESRSDGLEVPSSASETDCSSDKAV